MKEETQIAHGGREIDPKIDIVNPPVIRASTVLYPSLAALATQLQAYVYGRRGTPTTRALEAAINALEGGEATLLVPSGLAAITCALLSVLSAGDELLVTDSCYGPTRQFCDRLARRLGIGVRYYDPRIGAGIAALMGLQTRAVFCESPGSQSFEIQDIPAIAKAAHEQDAVVLVDNTWASPLFCKPLVLGADISIQSATKYIGGHSDLMLGSISAAGPAAKSVAETHGLLGHCVGPDEAYLTLRGLRTLSVRMRQHEANGLAVARWLKGRPEIEEVLHPGLPDAPGHDLWKRDFTGASGTFTIILKPCGEKQIAALVDPLKLFGIGYSFGGFESLILPVNPTAIRTAVPWRRGPALRLHIGLEDPGDLIADLEAGFARFKEAQNA
jgi:cysteine-S-conjugate beta-lyase